MVAHDDDRDVAETLKAGYDAPPPRPEFVEEVRGRLREELAAAQASRRRLLRLWRYVAAAAAIVVAVGLGAVGFRDTSCAPKEPGTLPGPEALSTPGRPVPLCLQLPPPLFLCTPRLIRLTAHMEPYEPEKPRQPLLVPPGTRNVALAKPVTHSDATGPVIGHLSQVNDGEKSDVDGRYVEFVPMGEQATWIQIDLEEPCVIYAIALWHSLWPTVFHDVIVQVSDDPEFRRGVHTLFNNDFDNSAGLGAGEDREYIEDYRGRLIEAGGVTARYVRLYSRGCIDGALDRYAEVEVHGQPAGEAVRCRSRSRPLAQPPQTAPRRRPSAWPWRASWTRLLRPKGRARCPLPCRLPRPKTGAVPWCRWNSACPGLSSAAAPRNTSSRTCTSRNTRANRGRLFWSPRARRTSPGASP